MPIPEGFKPGDKCPTCGHTFYREVGDDYTIEGCSQFCDEVPEEELERFRELQPGEYGLHPCAGCGCTLEGEYLPGNVCSKCYDKERIKNRTRLLERVLGHLPQDLAGEVRAELGKKIHV